MGIIWRDTFVVDRAEHSDFLEAALQAMRRLPIHIADRYTRRDQQTDLLRAIERAARNVARTGYDSLCRIQFAPFEIASLDPITARHDMPPNVLTSEHLYEAAMTADHEGAWIRVQPILLLHKAGACIMEYNAMIYGPGEGFTPEQAIQVVRLGIETLMVRVGDTWGAMLPTTPPLWDKAPVIDAANERSLLITSLRDITQYALAPLIVEATRPRRRGKRDEPENPPRPTGSTTVTLIETFPPAGQDFTPFVKAYAAPLRGIGAMDAYYQERASWLVERELFDNLSTDAEMAAYLLGNSELFVYNDRLKGLIPETRRRIRTRSSDTAITYMSMHYAALMEWIYIQDALLSAYIRRLDSLAAQQSPRREELIKVLQGALGELVQYQENITPFTNRIEFLTRAGVYHNIPQLAERFERKQELLLAYATEYHDYREARAADFLNWLAGILAAAELSSILIPLTGITQESNPGLYAAIALSAIGLVFIALAVVNRERRR
jgi:hypothetical protein